MSIKQVIEALETSLQLLKRYVSETPLGNQPHMIVEPAMAAIASGDAALAALRSMPAEPYAYAVYFPDQPTEELVHDLDELLDDMTNREHTITELFATPHTEAVRMSEAEIGNAIASHIIGESATYNQLQKFARAVEQATAARLGVKMGDV